MDSYTFRSHLYGVIVGLRVLIETDQIGSERAAEVCEYLAYIEELSAIQRISVSKSLLMAAQQAAEAARTGLSADDLFADTSDDTSEGDTDTDVPIVTPPKPKPRRRRRGAQS